jgi:hypothetical protein
MFAHVEIRGGGGRFLWNVVLLFLFGTACGVGLTVFFYEFGRVAPARSAGDPGLPAVRAGQLGRFHRDEHVPMTLRDYVDLVYLLRGQDGQARASFRRLFAPLIEAAQKDDPPDFLWVSHEELDSIIVPPEATEAWDLLRRVRGDRHRLPNDYRAEEWDAQVGWFLDRAHPDLAFLRDLVRRKDGKVIETGSGNGEAVVRAAEYIRCERKASNRIPPPPPAPPPAGPPPPPVR